MALRILETWKHKACQMVKGASPKKAQRYNWIRIANEGQSLIDWFFIRKDNYYVYRSFTEKWKQPLLWP